MRLGTTPSQTVGPFFSLALDWPGGPEAARADAPGAIRLGGRVLDGAGAGVPDALVETWQAPGLLARCATREDGGWAIRTVKPGAAEPGVAPHLTVAVFARGLLRHLVTRLYFPEETANDADPVLAALDADARATLLAARDGDGYRFDIRLQGPGETAFFAL